VEEFQYFTTSLKHKKEKISVENLIASFDVEHKAGPRTLEKELRASPSPTWFRRTMARTKEKISLTRLPHSRRR